MKITFKNVEKKYGDFYAVKDLDLEIKDGSLHFLLGPSGCGKTTTLRMLAGLENPTGGKILFDGQDVTNKSSAERNIGMVFQNYALWPHMTVLKNIEYGLKLRKLSKTEIKERIDDVLEVTQLTRFAQRFPGQLSGGQQQRVALARALAIRPSVLLLDEPLSNLDAKLRHEMRENILKIFRRTGITMVYVTHDQKEALSMATSISVMYAGELIQTGSPRELYNHPKTSFIAGFIGETNLYKGKFLSRDGDLCKVESDIGTLSARFPETANHHEFKQNDPIYVSIRPEAFKFAKSSDQNANNISAQLSHLTYLGESEQLELSYGDNAHIKASLFHGPEHEWRDGENVDLTVVADDVLVLPHEELGHGT